MTQVPFKGIERVPVKKLKPRFPPIDPGPSTSTMLSNGMPILATDLDAIELAEDVVKDTTAARSTDEKDKEEKKPLATPQVKKKEPKPFRQIRAAIIANSTVIHPGLMFSFSAVALPQLQATTSVIPVNEQQASWIASVASFVTPVGCLAGGIIMDRYGRKATLQLLTIPCVLGWVFVGIAGLLTPVVFTPSTALNLIYLGRILQGIGTGMVAATSRIYTSEITTPKFRGSLCALASLGVSTGVLLGYSFGALVTWPFVAFLAGVVPFLCLMFILVLLPETPTWLLRNKREADAREALKKVREENTPDGELTRELSVLGGELRSDANIDLNETTLSRITKRSNLHPLSLITFYFFTYQFSGISILTFYNVQVIEKTGADVNGYATAVFLGCVRLVCNIFGCYLLWHSERRTLTLFSGVTSGLAMLSLATHGYALEQNVINGTTWLARHLPLVFITWFYVTYSIGYLLIPWILIGEFYAAEDRGVLGGISSCIAHTFLFIAVKSFPLFTDTFGFFGCFWFYGTVITFGSMGLFVLMPETRGKTLLEIEELFKPYNVRRSRNPL